MLIVTRSTSTTHFFEILYSLFIINLVCFNFQTHLGIPDSTSYFKRSSTLKWTFTTIPCSGWNVLSFYCSYPDRRCSWIRRGPWKVGTTLTPAKFMAFSWESKGTLSPRFVPTSVSHFLPSRVYYHWNRSDITNKLSLVVGWLQEKELGFQYQCSILLFLFRGLKYLKKKRNVWLQTWFIRVSWKDISAMKSKWWCFLQFLLSQGWQIDLHRWLCCEVDSNLLYFVYVFCITHFSEPWMSFFFSFVIRNL